MPPIRSQFCDANGFTVVTQQFGTIRVNVSTVVNTTTVTVLQNGVQKSQFAVSNITATQLESGAALRVRNLLAQRFGFDIHVFSVNPFHCSILSVNHGDPIPPNWWAETE